MRVDIDITIDDVLDEFSVHELYDAIKDQPEFAQLQTGIAGDTQPTEATIIRALCEKRQPRNLPLSGEDAKRIVCEIIDDVIY